MDNENVLSETVSKLYDKVNENNLNTCKDCKWWDGLPTDSYNDCSHDKIYHYCPDYMERLPDALMVYYLEDKGGSIQTGPDFGCVHWEEKE